MPTRVTLDRIEQAARTIDPVFLDSPQFYCEPLSDLLGVRLLLKVETLNPIRSFKGRGADWFVSQLRETTPLVCASAGNFGQALAYACRKRRLPLTVYAARTANRLKIERMRRLGAEVILEGDDFDAAKLAARRAADDGRRLVEDGLDVETAEGAGTIGLELARLADPLDDLLVPLGNGGLMSGVGLAMQASSPRTRRIAVQAAGAPAMVESWRAGRPIAHASMATIADGIGVRAPIPEALDDLRGVIDDAILVGEASIVQAMRLLLEHAGVVVEPSGAVGIAAMLEQPAAFAGRTVGTLLCGGNVTEAQRLEWLA